VLNMGGVLDLCAWVCGRVSYVYVSVLCVSYACVLCVCYVLYFICYTIIMYTVCVFYMCMLCMLQYTVSVKSNLQSNKSKNVTV